MVLLTSNMVDVVIRSVRIYKVQKSGDLHDKLEKDVNLLCEHGPQGLAIKVFTGMYRSSFDLFHCRKIRWLSRTPAVLSRVCVRLKTFYLRHTRDETRKKHKFAFVHSTN